MQIKNCSDIRSRLVRTCLPWQAGHFVPSSTYYIDVSQTQVFVGPACTFIEKVAHVHPAALTLTPAIRFTCCERSLKLQTVSSLKDCASCQFWDLFWNHRQVFTGLVQIAGHVALLNKCRTAKSSKLQLTMLSKPI